MYRMLKNLTVVALALFAMNALAAPPKQLVTHNTTDFESNAFVDGTIPSQHPTRAHSDGKVFWTAVRIACFGHTVDNKCAALIKMATNTDSPITLGTVMMDMATGEISPKQISSNGFSMTVNGPAETTISKD